MLALWDAASSASDDPPPALAKVTSSPTRRAGRSGGTNRAHEDEDAEHGAAERVVERQAVAQPVRHGEHPRADHERRCSRQPVVPCSVEQVALSKGPFGKVDGTPAQT